jgi:hypothetical protein
MIHRVLRRLRDEDATAMTEFVICLPVFLILFVGIADLGKMLSVGTEVKVRANTEMWNDALPVSKDLIDPVHMSPTLAAGDAALDFTNKIGPYPISEAVLAASYGGLVADGSRLESAIIHKSGSIAAIDPTILFRVRPTSVNFAEDQIADAWPNPVPAGPGALAAWTPFTWWPPLQPLVPRQAIAAGARYGQEEGTHDDNVQTVWGNQHLEAWYDVQVAPRPVDTEFIPVAFSRLGAEEYGCVSSVLGINIIPRHLIGCQAFFWMPPIPSAWLWNTPMPPPPVF